MQSIRSMADLTIIFWLLLFGHHIFDVVEQFSIRQNDPMIDAAIRKYLWTSSIEMGFFAIAGIVLSYLTRSKSTSWAALGLSVLSAWALWKLQLSGFFMFVRSHIENANLFADWWQMESTPVFSLAIIFFLIFSTVCWVFVWDGFRKHCDAFAD